MVRIVTICRFNWCSLTRVSPLQKFPLSKFCSSRLQPIVGWIHLHHTRTAVAFARWNFEYCLPERKIIKPQNLLMQSNQVQFIFINYRWVIHDISKQMEQCARKIFARWHKPIAITSVYCKEGASFCPLIHDITLHYTTMNSHK